MGIIAYIVVGAFLTGFTVPQEEKQTTWSFVFNVLTWPALLLSLVVGLGAVARKSVLNQAEEQKALPEPDPEPSEKDEILTEVSEYLDTFKN